MNTPAISGDKLFLTIKKMKIEKSDVDDSDDPKAETSVILRSIDSSTGLTHWEKSYSGISSTLVSRDGLKLALLYQDARYQLIDFEREDIFQAPENINMLSRTPSRISAANLQGSTLLLGTFNKEILIFSLENSGKLLKRVDAGSIPQKIFYDGQHILAWTDSVGSLKVLDLKSESKTALWKKKGGAAFVDAEFTDEGLFVTSLDNFAYLLNKKGGDIIWKKRFGDRLIYKPLVKKNLAVIVPFESGTAYILNLSDGKVVNTLTLSDAGKFISSPLSDGNNLIFVTNNGVVSFSDSDSSKNICQNK